MPDTYKWKLKEGVLLGSATAATQIEGGNRDNSWYSWYLAGHIKDGSDPSRADDHYARWKEDIDLMGEMGLQIYRMGIEWARIEPQQGVFNREVVKHYREEIGYLLEKGIKPMVTLHHFTNPSWFEAMGAFEKAENIPVFLEFVRFIVENLADLVSEYITINEPNVYAANGYAFGEWPPGKKNYSLAMRVMENMAVCHIKAYGMIHEIRKSMNLSDTKVGVANHLRIFRARHRWNLIDCIGSRALERAFQGAVTEAFHTGKFKFPLKKQKGTIRGRYYDFLGLNYYTRSLVKGFTAMDKKKAEKNDLGWEIYPKGIRRLSQKLYRKYRAPIFVTENGTADGKDAFRSRYLCDHLEELMKAECPVERYYHWSFLDNFEWLEGESSAFGLVRVNYETQRREVRESGKFYSQIIRAKGVTEEMYRTYVEGKGTGV